MVLCMCNYSACLKPFLVQSELYSSRVKEFEVRGRSTHPRTESSDYAKALNSSQWQLLGRFNASNAKGVQVGAYKHTRHCEGAMQFYACYLFSHTRENISELQPSTA